MKVLDGLAPRRKEELLGLLLLAFAILLLCALVSHSGRDDRHFSAASDLTEVQFAPRNWVGLAGAGLAYLLSYLAGYLAIFLPIFAFLLGFKFLVKWKLPRVWAKTYQALFIVLAVFVVVSLPLLHSGEPISFVSAPGGALGIGLASFLTKYFGLVGAIVICGTAILVFLFLITEWRPYWWEHEVATWPLRVRLKFQSYFGFGAARKRESEVAAPPQPMPVDEPVPTPRHGFFSRIWRGIGGLFKIERPEAEVEPERPEASPTEGLGIRVIEKLEQLEAEQKRGEGPLAPHRPTRRPSIKLTRGPEGGYQYPELGLLAENLQAKQSVSGTELTQVATKLVETLKTFNIEVVGERVEKFPGPVITRYEFKPGPGIKVNQVLNLADDLALALQAKRVRIIAPVPGKSAIGVEIPNRFPQTVFLRDIFSSKEFAESRVALPLGLGLSTAGEPVLTDLAVMPHLLIAGATGSGKSVCINVIVTSLIFKHHPSALRFIFIDPKMLELSVYSGIPHLERPVVTRPKQAETVLNDTVFEMEDRYKKLASKSTRHITQYNAKVSEAERLPYLIVIVDELADLMMSNSGSRIEILITRLAQMARAVGIHLILATQRPSVDVITGLIKANFSARIAFQVASKVDSRTILDANGAEKLLGAGDMLFLAPGQAEPTRIHGAYVSSEETGRLVEFLRAQNVPMQPIDNLTEEAGEQRSLLSESDPLFKEAAEVVIRNKQGSVSLLQRRLGVGYQRAARLIDLLEEKGVVGSYDGSKAREVLVDERFLETFKNQL